MAYVNSIKSIWEKADSSYIEATKPGGRTPVSKRLFPQANSQTNQQYKQQQIVDDDASETSSTLESLGDFDAIPEEFRPSRRGKDLMKVAASPKKENSQEKEEPPKNGRSLNKPELVRRFKSDARNSNPSTKARNAEKELLDSGDFKQSQEANDMISDGTGKEKKSNQIFFYSSQNESALKTRDGCQQNWPEKKNGRESSESKLKNAKDGNHFKSGFYDSESKSSKSTKEFDISSSPENHGEENKFYKNIPPKFQDKNATNQKKASFKDKGSQKITREVTVEKRIKWNSELCELKKPQNKPDYFYEYTKTTKESVKYVPSESEDENGDCLTTKKPYQDFKKGRDLCNHFRRKNFRQYNQRPANQRDVGFNSTFKAQRNEEKNFSRERPQNPGHKFEKNHSFFQCGNDKDPIIIRHEIKVIHVNEEGKNNRMFNRSSQPFRPNKERNGSVIHNGPRGRNGNVVHNGPIGRNGNVGHNDSRGNGNINSNDHREGNGKINNNDNKGRNGETIGVDIRERNKHKNKTVTRQYCGVKIEENTMTKTAEGFLKTRKQFVRIPMKLPGSPPKTENVDRPISNEQRSALVKYGREISDMIAGSYVAITVFLDNYEQWKDFRRVTMLLFEEVEKNLSQSRYGNKRIIEVAELVGVGCKIAQFAPHPGVSAAAKVIAFLSDVVARIFSSSNSSKSINLDDFSLKLSLQKDMDSTTDIYMYGMQCDINFQETCEMIEEFHREIQNGRFKEFEETFEAGFLKEISLLNPRYPAVFYKKLGRFYKLLNEHQQSEEGKAFCGAFEDWPDALTTVSRLYRRFKTENWDSTSVMKAWEEVYNLLQNKESVVEDVLKRIQDCIFVLTREQSIMERYVMDLQRQC